MILSVAADDHLPSGTLISITSSSGIEVNAIADCFVPSITLRYPLKHSHPLGASIKELLPGDPLSQEFLQEMAGNEYQTDAAGKPYSELVGLVNIGLAWIFIL